MAEKKYVVEMGSGNRHSSHSAPLILELLVDFESFEEVNCLIYLKFGGSGGSTQNVRDECLRYEFVNIRDDTHMTSIKIAQFSRFPTPSCPTTPKIFPPY